MPSWPRARISCGMQHAGPHSMTRDAYGVAVWVDPWFVTGLAEGERHAEASFAFRQTGHKPGVQPDCDSIDIPIP